MGNTISPWKLLETKVVLDHAQLKVQEDTIELPNKAVKQYVRHSPVEHHAVIVIAINKNGEVLVQREYSHPVGKVMWQLPGGSMLADETAEQAAKRELSEESGLSAHQTRLLGYFYIHNRLSDKKQFVVECSDVYELVGQPDDDEFIVSSWLTTEKVERLIKSGEVTNINFLATYTLWLLKK